MRKAWATAADSLTRSCIGPCQIPFWFKLFWAKKSHRISRCRFESGSRASVTSLVAGSSFCPSMYALANLMRFWAPELDKRYWVRDVEKAPSIWRGNKSERSLSWALCFLTRCAFHSFLLWLFLHFWFKYYILLYWVKWRLYSTRIFSQIT